MVESEDFSEDEEEDESSFNDPPPKWELYLFLFIFNPSLAPLPLVKNVGKVLSRLLNLQTEKGTKTGRFSKDFQNTSKSEQINTLEA